MTDCIEIRLPDEQSTFRAARSLAYSLYHFPLTITLTGELGTGKTTFVRGLGRALGIREYITSPTYTLEQRYVGSQRGSRPVTHLDLYRLDQRQARELVQATDDHPGIRIIEWANRFEGIADCPIVQIVMRDTPSEGGGRILSVEFRDIALPSREDIERWRTEVRLPAHICAHCDVVAAFAERLGGMLAWRGEIYRPLALRRAAEVHDLLRFLDFRMQGNPAHYPASFRAEEEQSAAHWQKWRARYADMRHEAACEIFLAERGFREIGAIVAPHGLVRPTPPRSTIEQKLLFYADKRVVVDRVVTLDERFRDFALRYGGGQSSEESERWYRESKAVEEDLFPAGAP